MGRLPMVTKRQLGVGYLLGTGLGLLLSLIAFLAMAGSVPVSSWIGTFVAAMLAGSLIYAGIWLHRSDLPEDPIWNIARWSTFGLSLPTVLGILFTVGKLQPRLFTLYPTIFATSIAAGGVIGVLYGTVNELRSEHEKALDLNRKNAVMNRVLRHNIRNDMNVILGHLDRLNGLNGTDTEALNPIRRKVQDVVSLSDTARKIDSIGTTREAVPRNLVAIVEKRVQGIRADYPTVSLTTELPSEAWVSADSLLPSVLDNLLDNAITHSDDDPEIHLSITDHDDYVHLRVADNGPGIPDREQQVIRNGGETDLLHSEGLGLWLAKWTIESYGGELRFDETETQGSVVELRIPATRPDARAQTHMRANNRQ